MNRRDFLLTSAAAGIVAQAQAADPAASAKPAAERKLRVVVIGHTGRGDYGHGLNTMWSALPETELVAIADADAAGLAAQLKLRGVEKGYADYKQALAETKPDLVAIGMRHVDQHREAVLAAVAAGVRGIYIEKPFCRTPAEADEIVAACESKNVKLAVAHRNRNHPVLPAIAKLMADGKLGRVLEIRARGKEDTRGGALDLWVLGGHALNLCAYFAGKPVACSATVLRDGRPIVKADVGPGAEGLGPLAGNEVHARYEFESGIPVFFDSIHDAGTKQAGFGLQIIGTEGIVDMRIDQEPLASFLAGNPLRPSKEPRQWTTISSAGIGAPEPLDGIAKQVMNHVVGGKDLIAAIAENRKPLCDMYEARTIVEMIAAVFESHVRGGARVTFPLAQRDNPLTRLG
ncbi:MAG: Gfo/Idh/MocA family oxidoreductase [Planctomycetia bacterium]|nr:Gfo/Idh/MocA family oxidoreductase [Planctomycetia bacterium]